MNIGTPSFCFCLLNRITRQLLSYRNIRTASIVSQVLLDPKSALKVPIHSHVRTQRFASKNELTGKLSFSDKILTIPNGLCLLRIGSTPIIGYLVITNHLVPACLLFVVAGITDLLDGYIARNVPNQSSAVGSIIDPLADKFLVTTLFLALTYVNMIPVWLTTVVIIRDVGLILGGIVKRLRMIPSPLTVKRFFSPHISPFKVNPTFISKLNTLLQLCVVTCSLAAPVFGLPSHLFFTYLYCITALTTVSSGLQYALHDRMNLIK